MFNRRKFEAQVILEGRTMAGVADRLKIGRATLWRKITGKSEFTRTEISELIIYLNITNPSDIFFSQEVAEKQQAKEKETA